MSDNKVPHVYAAIAEVMAKLAKTGIAKDRNNQQQGYKFRGIDDMYNALAPYLSESKLLIMPRMLEREITERVSGSNKPLFYVVVKAAFDFTSAVDGTVKTVEMYGEGMDSADKATNKAMSAAYKYACMQAFCIPTEGDNDADSTTHDVQTVHPPEGYASWKANITAVADEGTARLQDTWKQSAAALRNHAVKHDLQWWNGCKEKAGKVKDAA